MHKVTSPVGTEILVPEIADEDGPTFSLSNMAAIRAYYEDNGYVVIKKVVAPEVCDQIRGAFSSSVKPYDGHIYRQTTANPEKNKINEFGFVMNPILNLQSLGVSKFAALKDMAIKTFSGDPIKNISKAIFQEEGQLVQSMYFEGNSETWPHQDTYYLDSETIGTMIGCWYALEDINAGAGRFFVIPGSHKVDMRKNGKDIDFAFNHSRYKDLVRSILTEGNVQFRAPLLNKGDAIVWNSKTIHGSLRTTRPQFSRSSLTAHYIPASHRFLQFQTRIKALKLRRFEGMSFHCPKDMDLMSSRLVMAVETTFPKTFQMTKKLAIKAMLK